MENVTAMCLENVRCAYFNGFKPNDPLNTGNPRYSVQIIFDKNHPQLEQLNKIILNAAEKKFSNKYSFTDGNLPPQLRNPLRDGDNPDVKGDEYRGKYFFNASTKPDYPPEIVGRDALPITEGDGIIYSGCYINVKVKAYAYDVSGNRGIALAFNGAQFVHDAPSLGNAVHFRNLDKQDEELLN